MDIWEKLYERAKKEYDPKEVTPLSTLIMSYVF